MPQQGQDALLAGQDGLNRGQPLMLPPRGAPDQLEIGAQNPSQDRLHDTVTQERFHASGSSTGSASRS